ncbi:MAG: hypothetical protein JST54_25035 [Deltaproteobacteria bacterium]|nr:hypothetical protein [Deltaproteobacteria bacterium]
MSSTTVKNAILTALQTPKGRAEISKAEAQAITKAATAGAGSASKVTADEARLIGQLLNQDSFEGGPAKYTLTAPAKQVLEQFAVSQHLPYGSNAGTLAGQLSAVVDAANLAWVTPLTQAPSTRSLLPIPLNDASFNLPAREAYVNPSSGQFYVKQGSGKSAQWFGPMAIPGSDAHAAQNSALLATLNSAVKGMDLLSEGDFGWDAVLLSGAGTSKPTADDFSKALGLPAGTPVEVDDADDWFANRTGIDPGADDDFSKQQSAQYASVKALLSQNLTDIQVFRTGTIDVGTYIVGRTPNGDLVGIHSTAVET